MTFLSLIIQLFRIQKWFWFCMSRLHSFRFLDMSWKVCNLGHRQQCLLDSSVRTVGGGRRRGKMLPAAQSTTIGEWTGRFGGCLAIICICDLSSIIVSVSGKLSCGLAPSHNSFLSLSLEIQCYANIFRCCLPIRVMNTDIDGAQRMNPDDSGNPLTEFSLVKHHNI